MKKLTAYVDGDILAYRAAATIDKDSDFDGFQTFLPRRGEEMFWELLDKWIPDGLPIRKVIPVFTRGGNFRFDVADDYKANRNDSARPPNLKPLRKRLIGLKGSLSHDLLEADDLIGLACTERPDETVAISLDKDFRTLPCLLWIPSKVDGKGEMIRISKDQANLYWMRQTLIGDVTDNIIGLYRVGPKKAEKWLPNEAPLEDLWPQVVKRYVEAGHTAEDALKNARLTRILRHGDYDEEAGVRLWEPPGALAQDGYAKAA